MHFYNTRDVGIWPEPEASVNLDLMNMGNLGLTLSEETAIVAFLKILSDGYTDGSSEFEVQVVIVGSLIVVMACLVVFAVFRKNKIYQKNKAAN